MIPNAIDSQAQEEDIRQADIASIIDVTDSRFAADDAIMMPPPLNPPPLRQSQRQRERLERIAEQQRTQKEIIPEFRSLGRRCKENHFASKSKNHNGLSCGAISVNHMPTYYDSLRPVSKFFFSFIIIFDSEW
jgi:hypothetical protein